MGSSSATASPSERPNTPRNATIGIIRPRSKKAFAGGFTALGIQRYKVLNIETPFPRALSRAFPAKYGRNARFTSAASLAPMRSASRRLACIHVGDTWYVTRMLGPTVAQVVGRSYAQYTGGRPGDTRQGLSVRCCWHELLNTRRGGYGAGGQVST